MIKGKTPEEIRKLFNIVNDFTPEEEVRLYVSFLFMPLIVLAILSGSNQEGECKHCSLASIYASNYLLQEWAEDR